MPRTVQDNGDSTDKKVMERPFAKSISKTDRLNQLRAKVSSDDSLAILIRADPDAIAAALALKRLFWRRAKNIGIYRINDIKRPDNVALIRSLKISLGHFKRIDSSAYTKWALLDSQPHHADQFGDVPFDIIIDHHPAEADFKAGLIDIRPEYGAVSTIMTEYLRASAIQPSPRLATALFYGIKTDTGNFVRPVIQNDLNAFRYLYRFANINLVRKIESSEMTKRTLSIFRQGIDNLVLYQNVAFVHMERLNNPDALVSVADFFLNLAEATWSIASAKCGDSLVVILRNAGFRRDAGKLAQQLFGKWGRAGGHRTAARAELPLGAIRSRARSEAGYRNFVLEQIKKEWENG
jgi:nanoRNase/pAp phosphatase (c-di-AMP/oligoRNAs hydrolase)